MRNPSIKRDGFTLVEVMLSLAIVSIGLVAILGLLPTGVKSARDAGDNTLSATIIQDIFSNMRSQPFISIDLGGSSTINLKIAGTQTLLYDISGDLVNTVAASYYQVLLSYQPQATGLSLVQATVTWHAGSASAVANVFTTYIAQYDQ